MSSREIPSWKALLMSLLMKAAHWSLKLGGRLPARADPGDLLHADAERLTRRLLEK